MVDWFASQCAVPLRLERCTLEKYVEVMEDIRDYFSQDIPEEHMDQFVQYAGTGLMLCPDPKTAYNFIKKHDLYRPCEDIWAIWDSMPKAETVQHQPVDRKAVVTPYQFSQHTPTARTADEIAEDPAVVDRIAAVARNGGGVVYLVDVVRETEVNRICSPEIWEAIRRRLPTGWTLSDSLTGAKAYKYLNHPDATGDF